MSAVALHGGLVVQAGQELIGVHRRQDGANVRLRRAETQHHVTRRNSQESQCDMNSKTTRDQVQLEQQHMMETQLEETLQEGQEKWGRAGAVGGAGELE